MTEFTPTTVKRRTRPASLYVGSNGQWLLNPALIKKTGTYDKDKLKLLLDNDKRLYITRSDDGFAVCEKKQKGRTVLAFTSLNARNNIFDTLGIYSASHTFKVKPQPVEKPGYVNPLFELDTTAIK